jgi:hypothetical protein
MERLMKKLLENANLDAVPQQVDVKYGITPKEDRPKTPSHKFGGP